MIKVHKASDGLLKQLIEVRANALVSDVPADLGGEDAGPEPHDLLDAALGACTAITVTMVAQRKKMPLEDVRVEVTREESGGLYKLFRRVELIGALDPAQREYLLGIANKCPIHKALNGRFEISTELAG
ncbi:MAG: OsmC family protein [Panacagrimonas sp.]